MSCSRCTQNNSKNPELTQLTSATVYVEYHVVGLLSALPVFMSAGLSIQTAKEAHCTQSEMKNIVCFLETVTQDTGSVYS